jgi:aspartate aminotransferase-like enzyme
VPAYYADIVRWQPIMENPSAYFSTSAVNEILALHEATKIIMEEGLEERFLRHAAIARGLRAGMAELDMKPFTSEAYLADTLSLFIYPDGVEDSAFRSAMAASGVVIAGCLGLLAGKGCRIGHMGNIGVAEVTKTLAAAERAAISCGEKIRRGSAIAAASEFLEW